MDGDRDTSTVKDTIVFNIDSHSYRFSVAINRNKKYKLKIKKSQVQAPGC